MHGTATRTSGGLTKEDLMYVTKSDGSRRIVSRKASAAGKKAMNRLRASGKAAAPFQRKTKKANSANKKSNTKKSNTITNSKGRVHNASSGKYVSPGKGGGRFW